jgi:hypothetical protein
MATSHTATKPIPIPGSGASSIGSRSISSTNEGYFNKPHKNTRPDWIKGYDYICRTLGKTEANARYDGVKDWIAGEKLAGRSGNTTGATRKGRKNRKTRKTRNLKRK